MIDPGSFYHSTDHPDAESSSRMWENIERQLHREKPSLFSVADRRSFVYGIAAAILLYFTSIGIYTTIKQSIENSKPQTVRLDEAYQSAIKDFEKVAPQSALTGTVSESDKNYLNLRWDELQKIDAAIADLKQQLGGSDYSPLSRQRLHQLYSMKLNVLQELIDHGAIEL